MQVSNGHHREPDLEGSDYIYILKSEFAASGSFHVRAPKCRPRTGQWPCAGAMQSLLKEDDVSMREEVWEEWEGEVQEAIV